MNSKQTDNQALPPNFVIYDHLAPSPLFPPKDVAYIESVRGDFFEGDLKKLRSFERFILNLNTGAVSGSALPGLREEPDRGHLYVKRYSNQPWEDFVRVFVAKISDGFPDKVRCLMPMVQVTLPNGDRYYPITFLGNRAEWRRQLAKAADACGTSLGRFDKSTFAVSDGKVFDFASLTLARLKKGERPSTDW